MGYRQQPPHRLPTTTTSRLPPNMPDTPLPKTDMRLPSSWVSTPGQWPFDADNPDHYKSNRRTIKPPPSHPFSLLTLHTALRSKYAPQCCYQHYIPSSSISMTNYTIDWPCGCPLPNLCQLNDEACATLFRHVCHCTLDSATHSLCPQCRLGNGINHKGLTPVGYLVFSNTWQSIRARRYGPPTKPPTKPPTEPPTKPPKKPPKKRSRCGSRTSLTDRKGYRRGRKRPKSS